MVQVRPLRVVLGGVVATLVALLGVGCGPSTGSARVPPAQPEPAASPTTAPPVVDDTPRPGQGALVTVSVANVWKEPGVGRPVDQPSLGNPVDIRGWVAAMSHEDKLWLVDRLVTQALYGERVAVHDVRDGWARVAITGQPSSLDPAGYPGWIPVVQLRAAELPSTPLSAVVTRPSAVVREPGRSTEVSYNTRLPVLDAGASEVTVALPTGGKGEVAAGDVEVAPPGPRAVTGANLVRHARLFSGLPYLWGGTSYAGFDCSGFTAALYAAHGVVIPRDADDQAGVGRAVERTQLQPGDLLFFSSGPDQRSIHHVSMYVGNGMMIQAPATGRTVETVPVDTPQYARQYWGSRRYLP